ncbi:hypothetical protein SCOR_17610 [Sulfidibacter corallicola]|uniref:Uncharacterized protein n=1 Tax=Sulfidibacter corallicola TaxID=2818388 RepID=A0A8A4TX05_SULCO|nr:hypothetical protein [Sulfidibacter corallicola]QTD53728.1 hypothetical protein J3U87_14845 [Sulfidibacter corallicola]
MPRRGLTALVLWLTGTLLFASTPRYSEDYGSLFIQARQTPSALSGHGYTSLEFDLVNKLDSRPLEVKISLFAGYHLYSNNDAELAYGRTFSLSAGESRRVRVPFWRWCGQPDRAQIWLDGKAMENLLLVPMGHEAVPNAPNFGVVTVLFSKSIEAPEDIAHLAENPQVQHDGSSVKTSAGTAGYLEADQSDIERWSDFWLDYTQFDMVALTGSDWSSLTGGQREALRTYVHAGGILLLDRSTNLPHELKPRDHQTRLGMPLSFVGFGLVYACAGSLTDLSAEQWYLFLDDSIANGKRWEQTLGNALQNNELFSVIEGLGIPVRSFIVLLIVFVLLIGPLNLLFVIKKGRRIWIFWTIPLLSIFATGSLVAAALVSDGLSIKLRSVGFTLLDQTRHRAISVGTTGVYSPLTSSQGLQFGAGTEIFPMFQQQSGNRGVSLDGGQILTNGWLRARLPFHYQERKVELRRERLVMESKDGRTIEVTNGLGVHIEELWVANGAGRIFRAIEIEPGGRVRAQPDPSLQATAVPPSLCREAYFLPWNKDVKEFEARFRPSANQIFLNPHDYLAVVRGTPFLDTTLSEDIERSSKTLVYGIREGAP